MRKLGLLELTFSSPFCGFKLPPTWGLKSLALIQLAPSEKSSRFGLGRKECHDYFSVNVGAGGDQEVFDKTYPSRRSQLGSRVALPSADIAATTVDPVAISSSPKRISYSWVIRTFLA